MSTEFPDQPAPGPLDQELPGRQLQAAREALGFSVEQIADQLKLHPRQVRAIEAGDYAALPPAAVTRGFVRLYARAVRLDPTPLVAMLPTDAAANAADTSQARINRPAAKPATFTKSRYPSNGKRRTFPVVPVVGAAVIAAAIAAAWYFGWGTGHQEGATTVSGEVMPPASHAPTATTPGTTTAPAASPAANGAEGGTLNPTVPLISVPPPAAAPGTGATGNTPAGVAPADGAQAPANGAAGAAGATGKAPAPTGGTAALAPAATAPAGVTPTRTAATLTASPAPAASSANALVLTVTQDSWIQVKPANGAALLARLVKAGSTETVDVTGPVLLTVGNPAGVTATLRGGAVALPSQKGQVARVNLK